MKAFNLFQKFGLAAMIAIVVIVGGSALGIYNSSYGPAYDTAFTEGINKYGSMKIEGNKVYDGESKKILARKDAKEEAFKKASADASSPLFTYIFILIIIGGALALILPVLNGISTPKVFIRPGIGIGALGLLILICKSAADPNLGSKHLNVSTETILWSDALILTAGLVIFLGVAAVFVGQIIKALNYFR